LALDACHDNSTVDLDESTTTWKLIASSKHRSIKKSSTLMTTLHPNNVDGEAKKNPANAMHAR
jgi:hypothetical protein